MTDQELLELAAKAAGQEYIDDMTAAFRCNPKRWNPLTDDGDALRLAVRLQLDVSCMENGAAAASTRRAIVRAAAEIGKSMP